MTSKILDLIIDLTFAKYCKVEEVSYQEDKLVCSDVNKLQEELKKNLKEVLEDE